jgi:hypothetical protein
MEKLFITSTANPVMALRVRVMDPKLLNWTPNAGTLQQLTSINKVMAIYFIKLRRAAKTCLLSKRKFQSRMISGKW